MRNPRDESHENGLCFVGPPILAARLRSTQNQRLAAYFRRMRFLQSYGFTATIDASCPTFPSVYMNSIPVCEDEFPL
jgi:hypothetical protein